MSKIYQDGTYLEKNSTWHEEDSPLKAKWINKIIKINHLSPSTICEIGCGSGEILNQVSQKKTKKNLIFNFSDVLKETDKYFDIAMIVDVIEHIEDYFNFLRKVKEKANYKIFHVPLDSSILNLFRVSPIIEKRKKVGHIHYFTKETVLETLRDTGYTIIDYFYTSGSIDLPNQSWKSKLLKVPRKILFFLNKDFAVRVLGGYSLMILAK